MLHPTPLSFDSLDDQHKKRNMQGTSFPEPKDYDDDMMIIVDLWSITSYELMNDPVTKKSSDTVDQNNSDDDDDDDDADDLTSVTTVSLSSWEEWSLFENRDTTSPPPSVIHVPREEYAVSRRRPTVQQGLIVPVLHKALIVPNKTLDYQGKGAATPSDETDDASSVLSLGTLSSLGSLEESLNSLLAPSSLSLPA